MRELSGASNDLAKAARPVAKAATASAVERFARADPDLAVSGEAWDAVTKITGFAPSERADCPSWLRFLDETTGGDGELQAYLQRVVGYFLTGQTSEHALFFIYGPGGNGKTVFLDAITTLLAIMIVPRQSIPSPLVKMTGIQRNWQASRVRGWSLPQRPTRAIVGMRQK